VNDSARYIKIVEWSDEDQCFVGQCPGVVGTCCYGDNEAHVYAELCEIVDEWLEILKKDGKRLQAATAGQGIAERIACA
jgi:predicted RNase H-like HicB family nuclease